FQPFSGERLFTPLSSNVVDVTFFTPGTTQRATVSGFGAVFTDVDSSTATQVNVLDAAGNSLGIAAVPASNNGLSFFGVTFNADERIAKVEITLGNAALASTTNDD